MIAKSAIFALAKALEGIPILSTLSGSPAARAGLRYGDILISVNGVRTRTYLDYIAAKELRSDGMEIVVFRSGSESTKTLIYDRSAPPPDKAALLAEIVTLRITPDAFEGENGGGSTPLS